MRARFWLPTLASLTVAAAAPAWAASGNKAHDILINMPADKQAAALGKAVGEGCVGKTAFYMGMGEDKAATWSVRCTNGKSYAVQLNPDSTGSTSILEFPLLKAVANIECFKKF